MDYIFDAAVIWVDEVLKYSITFCNIYQLAVKKEIFLNAKYVVALDCFHTGGLVLAYIQSNRSDMKKGEGLPIDWRT